MIGIEKNKINYIDLFQFYDFFGTRTQFIDFSILASLLSTNILLKLLLLFHPLKLLLNPRNIKTHLSASQRAHLRCHTSHSHLDSFPRQCAITSPATELLDRRAKKRRDRHAKRIASRVKQNLCLMEKVATDWRWNLIAVHSARRSRPGVLNYMFLMEAAPIINIRSFEYRLHVDNLRLSRDVYRLAHLCTAHLTSLFLRSPSEKTSVHKREREKNRLAQEQIGWFSRQAIAARGDQDRCSPWRIKDFSLGTLQRPLATAIATLTYDCYCYRLSAFGRTRPFRKSLEITIFLIPPKKSFLKRNLREKLKGEKLQFNSKHFFLLFHRIVSDINTQLIKKNRRYFRRPDKRAAST